MVTVFNINMSVFAVSEENQPMLTEDSLLIISDVISNMRADKEAYGMSAVDFDHLFIGDEIPVYVSNQDSTIRSSNVHYYPILEDSKCVAIVVLGTDESGNLLVNASTWFSDKLNDAEINAPLAVILNEEAIVVSVGDSFGVARESLHYQKITQNCLPLPMGRELRAGSRYLNVPIFQQGAGTSICWALCIRSIAQYFGVYRTTDQIYDLMGIPYGQGSNDTNKMTYVMNSDLNLSASHVAHVSYSQLQNYINANKPVWAGAPDLSGTIGHAVVLRGYSEGTSTKLVSYMNPMYGEYWSSNVTSDGRFPVIYPNGNVFGYMNDFIAIGR